MNERVPSGPQMADELAELAIKHNHEQAQLAQQLADQEQAVRDTAVNQDKAIYERTISPEVSALNDQAEMEIFGSRDRTYTETKIDAKTGKEYTKVYNLGNPKRGKIEDIRSNPKYGKTDAEREQAAEAYQKDLEDLLEGGYEISQAKLALDLREDDAVKANKLAASYKSADESLSWEEAHKKADRRYLKIDRQRLALIQTKGIFSKAEYNKATAKTTVEKSVPKPVEEVEEPKTPLEKLGANKEFATAYGQVQEAFDNAIHGVPGADITQKRAKAVEAIRKFGASQGKDWEDSYTAAAIARLDNKIVEPLFEEELPTEQLAKNKTQRVAAEKVRVELADAVRRAQKAALDIHWSGETSFDDYKETLNETYDAIAELAEATGMHPGTQKAITHQLRNLIVFGKAKEQLKPVKGSPETIEAEDETRDAIWHGHAGDQPVVVLGEYGIGKDGKKYFKVAGSETGIAADELEFMKENGTAKDKIEARKRIAEIRGSKRTTKGQKPFDQDQELKIEPAVEVEDLKETEQITALQKIDMLRDQAVSILKSMRGLKKYSKKHMAEQNAKLEAVRKEFTSLISEAIAEESKEWSPAQKRSYISQQEGTFDKNIQQKIERDKKAEKAGKKQSKTAIVPLQPKSDAPGTKQANESTTVLPIVAVEKSKVSEEAQKERKRQKLVLAAGALILAALIGSTISRDKGDNTKSDQEETSTTALISPVPVPRDPQAPTTPADPNTTLHHMADTQ